MAKPLTACDCCFLVLSFLVLFSRRFTLRHLICFRPSSLGPDAGAAEKEEEGEDDRMDGRGAAAAAAAPVAAGTCASIATRVVYSS